MGGLPLTLLLAAGRTKELSPERLERFTQFSREQGLTDEDILILPRTGEHRQWERLGHRGGSGEQGVRYYGGLRGKRPSWLVPASLWGQHRASNGGTPCRVPGGGGSVVRRPLEELITAFLPPADKCMADAA